MRQSPRKPCRWTLSALAAGIAVASCGRIPEPPEPVPPPQVLKVDSLRQHDPLAPLPAPRPIAPTVRWVPSVLQEGTLVSLVIEPRANSVPVLDVTVSSGEQRLGLTQLSDGRWLALVAAPIGATEIPVDIGLRFVDGTRIQQTVALLVESREFPATRLRVARRFTAPDRATLQRIRREQARVRAVLGSVTDVPLWQGPFLKPVPGGTTSPYGQRRMFNGELRSRHTGLDLRGGTGDPIYAANSGRVALSDDLFFNGGAVFIDHGLGLYTGYFHMSRREVGEGEWVEKGQVIGRVGATGRVTGPHLHWSLYVQGRSLDPSSLLDPSFGDLSDRVPPAPLVTVGPGSEKAAAASCDGTSCN